MPMGNNIIHFALRKGEFNYNEVLILSENRTEILIMKMIFAVCRKTQ